MSLRREQYHALLATREFLYLLLDPAMRPKRVKELKGHASRCLRHFPFLDNHGRPQFSRDDFGPDAPPEPLTDIDEVER